MAQYTNANDVVSLAGDIDKVYICHIHPDHYCKETLNLLFKILEKRK